MSMIVAFNTKCLKNTNTISIKQIVVESYKKWVQEILCYKKWGEENISYKKWEEKPSKINNKWGGRKS